MVILPLVLSLILAAPVVGPAGSGAGQDRLILSVPVTHSDWMLRDGTAWGPEGVRHMLDTCKAAGWTRVYWRALDGGRSLYRSALMDPQGKWDTDNFWNPLAPEDTELASGYWGGMSPEARAALLGKLERFNYADFDSLAEAVRYGHEIGLEIHAWLSINEDDHAWGLMSRFSREHPEARWCKRDGSKYHSQLSFAFPEVMEYKLAIVREILTNYAVDGLLLDWIRTGDVRDNPQTDADGVANHGYEEPLIQGFKTRYGIDPRELPNNDERWVRFRAEPHSEFMRGVRRLSADIRPGTPVAVLVAHPWCYRGNRDKIDGNLRGLLLDVATWAREGLTDAAVAAGYYLEGGNAAAACASLRQETESRVDIWYFAWVPSAKDAFLNDFNTALAQGCRQMLLWEGDYIDGYPNKAELQELMRGKAVAPAGTP